MNASDSFPWLTMIFGQLASQLPVMIACLVGVILVLVRWKHISKGAPWALGGFGFTLALSVIVPAFYAFMQYRLQQGGNFRDMQTTYAVAGIFGALLHATCYVMLLVAILAGRPEALPPPPPWPGVAKV